MKLQVGLIQSSQVWENVPVNLRRAQEMIRETDADLVILPEMFTSGFTMNPSAVAEPHNGETVKWMLSQSNASGKAICGSIVIREEKDENTVYLNRLYFTKPCGELYFYDKRHLFRMGGENKIYTAGSSLPPVIEFKGFRIMPIICYDLRFPVWCRNTRDYDLLINCASWASARSDAWKTLLKARAIENVCYTAGVNRTGDDPAAHYSGNSIIYDFKGRILAAPSGEQEQIVRAVLDKKELDDFREKFPVRKDADSFELI